VNDRHSEITVRYPETVVLHAADGCASCGGKGWVVEPHGEQLDCDCCFRDDLSPSDMDAVEMGAYIVQPSESYLRRMAGNAEIGGGA
jgi:hypothetical protein